MQRENLYKKWKGASTIGKKNNKNQKKKRSQEKG